MIWWTLASTLFDKQRDCKEIQGDKRISILTACLWKIRQGKTKRFKRAQTVCGRPLNQAHVSLTLAQIS